MFGASYIVPDLPLWVVPVESNVKSKVTMYDVNSGYYTTLYDNQMNLETSEDYMHYKLKVLTNGGVDEASEINISFDSSYQTAAFHYVYIWRNGKKIDKTESLDLKLLTNEEQLESSIYSGKVKLYAILQDVRKNDIVEYAYTIIGGNPIYENYRYNSSGLQGYNPIDHLYIRFTYPKNANYQHRCIGCDESDIKKSEVDNNEVLLVEKYNLEIINFEETEPSWFLNYPLLSVSNFQDWKTINEWAYSIFEMDDVPNHIDEFEEIYGSLTSLDEKITAAINFVQNDIRYMGIESGIGSIKPFTPMEVLNQRFGDCKDKSLLLVSMLRNLGVQTSYPVLVSTSLTSHVDDFLPTGTLFDHCITYFEHDGKEYWIDPTLSAQGGNYKTIQVHDYGQALIIDKNSTELKSMSIVDTVTKTEIYEVFKIPNFTDDATLQITTKFTGLKADNFRSSLEYNSLKDISDYYKGYYENLFPSIISTEKMKVHDDLENNIITLEENYSFSNVWEQVNDGIYDRNAFTYEPINLYDYMTTLTCEKKSNPVDVPFPSQIYISTLLQLPDEILVEKLTEEVENGAFNFTYTQRNLGKKMVKLTYEYKSNNDYIAGKDFDEVCLEMNNVVKDLPLEFSFVDFSRKPKKPNSNSSPTDSKKKKHK
jgi:transglutaminase-like putative cysteine protease